MFKGKDLIAKDRTGSGKTIAYSLPVLEKLRLENSLENVPKFLIICPTRELAIQVGREIQSLRQNDR